MKTLFGDLELTIEVFKRRYNYHISKQFLYNMNLQLTELFTQVTLLSISKNVSIAWSDESDFIFQKGIISKLSFCIYINHNWNPIIVAWKSKSGKIYDIADTDINEQDIEFWFEGLDPLLYHKQLFPNEVLPFKLKNLSYQLTIHRLNKEADLVLQYQSKTNTEQNIENITLSIQQWLENFNQNSIKEDRKYGVVYSWNFVIEHATITYSIDFGSTGIYFLKQFLQFLSSLNCFKEVIIK